MPLALILMMTMIKVILRVRRNMIMNRKWQIHQPPTVNRKKRNMALKSLRKKKHKL